MRRNMQIRSTAEPTLPAMQGNASIPSNMVSSCPALTNRHHGPALVSCVRRLSSEERKSGTSIIGNPLAGCERVDSGRAVLSGWSLSCSHLISDQITFFPDHIGITTGPRKRALFVSCLLMWSIVRELAADRDALHPVSPLYFSHPVVAVRV